MWQCHSLLSCWCEISISCQCWLLYRYVLLVYCLYHVNVIYNIFTVLYYIAGGLTRNTSTTERKCLPGSYCTGDGIARSCPPGRYGNSFGLVSLNCMSLCGLISYDFYCIICLCMLLSLLSLYCRRILTAREVVYLDITVQKVALTLLRRCVVMLVIIVRSNIHTPMGI